MAGEQVRSGDELIEWLQLGQKEIPPRPFWNNFVSEMEQGGMTFNDMVDTTGEDKLPF